MRDGVPYDLHDDLQFVSSSGAAINAGYFQNVGVTRRQGLELGASTRVGMLALTLHYSFIDATFRDGFVESSPSNSTASPSGAITVRPGNRMPSIPRQALKLRAELNPGTSRPACSSCATCTHAGTRTIRTPAGAFQATEC